MTIQEAGLLLVGFFIQNSIFTDQNIHEILNDSKDKDKDKFSIYGALDEYVSLGILKKVEIPQGKGVSTGFVLIKPISTLLQNVSITLHTAAEMARILNKAFEMSGIKNRTVNIMNISENDIQTLLVLYNTLLDSVSGEQEKTN